MPMPDGGTCPFKSSEYHETDEVCPYCDGPLIDGRGDTATCQMCGRKCRRLPKTLPQAKRRLRQPLVFWMR